MRVAHVDLESNVLNWILLPQCELILADQEQGQGQLKENRLDVLLAQLSHLGLLQSCSHEPECRVECLSPHELLLSCQEHLQVRGAQLCRVILIKLLEEGVQAGLVGKNALVPRPRFKRDCNVSGGSARTNTSQFSRCRMKE